MLYLVLVPAGLAALLVFRQMSGPVHAGMALFVKLLPLLGAALVLHKLSIAVLDRFFVLGFTVAVLLTLLLDAHPLIIVLLHLDGRDCGGVSRGRGRSGAGHRANNDDCRRDKTYIRGRDLIRVFLRSFLIQASWSYDRMQSLGFAYAVLAGAAAGSTRIPGSTGRVCSCIWSISTLSLIWRRSFWEQRCGWRRSGQRAGTGQPMYRRSRIR